MPPFPSARMAAARRGTDRISVPGPPDAVRRRRSGTGDGAAGETTPGRSDTADEEARLAQRLRTLPEDRRAAPPRPWSDGLGRPLGGSGVGGEGGHVDGHDRVPTTCNSRGFETDEPRKPIEIEANHPAIDRQQGFDGCLAAGWSTAGSMPGSRIRRRRTRRETVGRRTSRGSAEGGAAMDVRHGRRLPPELMALELMALEPIAAARGRVPPVADPQHERTECGTHQRAHDGRGGSARRRHRRAHCQARDTSPRKHQDPMQDSSGCRDLGAAGGPTAGGRGRLTRGRRTPLPTRSAGSSAPSATGRSTGPPPGPRGWPTPPATARVACPRRRTPPCGWCGSRCPP